jgi:L-amino acid N-acyltransferase YncA
MTITLEPLAERHRKPVIDIFNHYIEHEYAAYLENRLPYEFFDMMLNVSKGFPAAAILGESGEVVGYGFLRAHSPMPVFKRTAEVSYFLHPEATGKGTGARLLAYLEEGAVKMGMRVLLASIASPNERSIQFHLKHGFTECGRFAGIAEKFGTRFDIVWMQKNI